MNTRPDSTSTHQDLTSLIGGNVYDAQGNKIGTAGKIYKSDATGAPEWVSVKTGLFGNRESFVPLNGARADDKGLHVTVHKDRVKDAPLIDTDGHLSNTETGELYRHYGLMPGGTAPDSDQTGTGRHAVPPQRTQTDADAAPGTQTDADTAQGTPAAMNRETAARPTPTAAGRAAAADPDYSHAQRQSMLRSEEQLRAGTESVEAGRVRLHKHVVTSQQQITVPIRREEAHVTREPVKPDEARMDGAMGDEELEVVLHEERPVVTKVVVPVERVTLSTETIQENREVSDTVRREEIDVEGDTERPPHGGQRRQ